MKEQLITFQLNNEPVSVYCDPSLSLLKLLRNRFNLLGTKEGCGRGDCGVCTVLLEGRAVNSCLVPAGKVQGRNILTIEGINIKNPAKAARFHPIQQAFVEKGAVQCGFCTPGMVMSAFALLQENPTPSKGEVREAISGNLCRCSGYKQIEEAVLEAAKVMACQNEQPGLK